MTDAQEALRQVREALADPALFDEGASVDDTFRAADNFGAACSPENVAAILADRDEREARLTRELAEARAGRDAMADVLPGHYYMDPPDGGDVPVLEQLRRMSRDAARYRFLSCKGVPPHSHRWSRWRLEYWNGEWWNPLVNDELDAAIDAQIEQERSDG